MRQYFTEKWLFRRVLLRSNIVYHKASRKQPGSPGCDSRPRPSFIKPCNFMSNYAVYWSQLSEINITQHSVEAGTAYSICTQAKHTLYEYSHILLYSYTGTTYSVCTQVQPTLCIHRHCLPCTHCMNSTQSYCNNLASHQCEDSCRM